MEINVALQSFVDKNRLTYSGCMKYKKSNGEWFASVSYSLSSKDYASVCLNALRSSLQRLPITGFVFVDVSSGIIVRDVVDILPINNMYRVQILYRIIRPSE